MTLLSRRSVSGLTRRERRRDHRFRPEMPEACESRLVLDGGGAGSLAFQFVSGNPFIIPPDAPGILTASTPYQHGNQICVTFYNNTSTAQSVNAALYNDPLENTTGEQQTLASFQTIVVAPNQSAEVCFVVVPGDCYQIDTRSGSLPSTVGNSTVPGTPHDFSAPGTALSYAVFCVPNGQNNGCFTQGYYKNHPDVVASLLNMLPGDKLVVGTTSYTADQLITILETPPAGGDSRMILAHQLITAELNLLNGCSPSVTDLYEINVGNSLLSGVDLLHLQGTVHNSTMTSVADYLDNFNNQDE